ncbi:Slam-dependent surface lipoprotein [Providencia manganoxydans]|uniref:Slam-dependent surface lipoprotein n=1 Tax=Providencia manganoxydans TaxID=2923283 RepID=UPI00280D7BC0|nr:transferrin-binding protein-like solute binding protein [Providencia stuartii]ELR5081401.1 transferrin-binding protein-like solute binding protein [Providencia stuartii]
MKNLSLAVLTIALSTSVFNASAEIAFAQSQKYGVDGVEVIVGDTQYASGSHAGAIGDPGIGLQPIFFGTRISFASFKARATENEHGVYELAASTSAHSANTGKFNFTQVANAEVYFGDWSKTGIDGDTTHTAFYSGKDVTESLPNSGQVEYTIAGINQFDSASKLSGAFNADFDTKTYTGALSGQSLNITMNGDILDQGQFEGKAVANESITGDSSGHFFGPDAEAVAGIVTFESEHIKDVAFGGSKAQ